MDQRRLLVLVASLVGSGLALYAAITDPIWNMERCGGYPGPEVPVFFWLGYICFTVVVFLRSSRKRVMVTWFCLSGLTWTLYVLARFGLPGLIQLAAAVICAVVFMTDKPFWQKTLALCGTMAAIGGAVFWTSNENTSPAAPTSAEVSPSRTRAEGINEWQAMITRDMERPEIADHQPAKDNTITITFADNGVVHKMNRNDDGAKVIKTILESSGHLFFPNGVTCELMEFSGHWAKEDNLMKFHMDSLTIGA